MMVLMMMKQRLFGTTSRILVRLTSRLQANHLGRLSMVRSTHSMKMVICFGAGLTKTMIDAQAMMDIRPVFITVVILMTALE